MKTKFYTICLLLALGVSARASLFTYSGGNAVIADNNTIGLTEIMSPAVSGLNWSISSVILNFTLAGGYGTDLSGYLRLGNTVTSPSYDLTGRLRAYPTLSGSGVNFSVDVTSAFTGYNPNNPWTLFFADTSAGGQTTLNGGWTLDITAVPEPVNVALGIFGIGLLVPAGVRFWRQRWALRSWSAN